MVCDYNFYGVKKSVSDTDFICLFVWYWSSMLDIVKNIAQFYLYNIYTTIWVDIFYYLDYTYMKLKKK